MFKRKGILRRQRQTVADFVAPDDQGAICFLFFFVLKKKHTSVVDFLPLISTMPLVGLDSCGNDRNVNPSDFFRNIDNFHHSKPDYCEELPRNRVTQISFN